MVLVSTTRAGARADGAERRRTHSSSGRHCSSPAAAAPPPHTRARAQSRTQTPTPSRALTYLRTYGFRSATLRAHDRAPQEILKDMNKGKNVTLTFLVPVEKEKPTR